MSAPKEAGLGLELAALEDVVGQAVEGEKGAALDQVQRMPCHT